MWFLLSLAALCAGTIRRSAEKDTASHIDSMALVWLQQAFALPFIVVPLFFVRFYWPADLSGHFWLLLAVYILCSSLDLYCYFRALRIADISYVAPLATLAVAGNFIGAYFILGQAPSYMGALGAACILAGAVISHRAKRRQQTAGNQYGLALLLMLVSVALKSFYSNIEVLMLQLSNPTSYNLYTSLLTIPFVIAVTLSVLHRRSEANRQYWSRLQTAVAHHTKPLLIIGGTYAFAMVASYQAKLISPNAAYVGAIKAAIVVPLVLVGVLFFKEQVSRLQWLGLGIIVAGIVALAYS